MFSNRFAGSRRNELPAHNLLPYMPVLFASSRNELSSSSPCFLPFCHHALVAARNPLELPVPSTTIWHAHAGCWAYFLRTTPMAALATTARLVVAFSYLLCTNSQYTYHQRLVCRTSPPDLLNVYARGSAVAYFSLTTGFDTSRISVRRG